MEFLAEQHPERLDTFLAKKGGGESRMFWKRAIEMGAVSVNGKMITKPSVKVKSGDRIAVDETKLPERRAVGELAPEPDLPLHIVYEDNDMLVVDKPAGMLVHPTELVRAHTLVNALLARYPEMRGVGGHPLRPSIVHRLDKDTSGLVAVAKTQQAFQYLTKQFLNREVKKTYLALVEGVPEKKEGIIDYAIRASTQNPSRKVAMRGAGGTRNTSARGAVTRYKIIEQFGDRFALLEVRPETGRTHQIRVHLKAIGHPVVGDRLYRRPRINADKTQTYAEITLHRQFLHAAKLQLAAPNGKLLTLTAPLPEELGKILSELRNPPVSDHLL